MGVPGKSAGKHALPVLPLLCFILPRSDGILTLLLLVSIEFIRFPVHTLPRHTHPFKDANGHLVPGSVAMMQLRISEVRP